jgi:hypothetical protein
MIGRHCPERAQCISGSLDHVTDPSPPIKCQLEVSVSLAIGTGQSVALLPASFIGYSTATLEILEQVFCGAEGPFHDDTSL